MSDIRVDAVSWERAQRHPLRRMVNLRIVCADGFRVSVQASPRHYAEDSHPTDQAPYWSLDERPVVYPFISFEVRYPSEPFADPRWDEFDSSGDDSKCGPWAFVPRALVDDLIASHGGSVGWERSDT